MATKVWKGVEACLSYVLKDYQLQLRQTRPPNQIDASDIENNNLPSFYVSGFTNDYSSVRVVEDHHPIPSAAILDRQLVETATMIHLCVGYDAGKQVKGCWR